MLPVLMFCLTVLLSSISSDENHSVPMHRRYDTENQEKTVIMMNIDGENVPVTLPVNDVPPNIPQNVHTHNPHRTERIDEQSLVILPELPDVASLRDTSPPVGINNSQGPVLPQTPLNPTNLTTNPPFPSVQLPLSPNLTSQVTAPINSPLPPIPPLNPVNNPSNTPPINSPPPPIPPLNPVNNPSNTPPINSPPPPIPPLNPVNNPSNTPQNFTPNPSNLPQSPILNPPNGPQNTVPNPSNSPQNPIPNPSNSTQSPISNSTPVNSSLPKDNSANTKPNNPSSTEVHVPPSNTQPKNPTKQDANNNIASIISDAGWFISAPFFVANDIFGQIYPIYTARPLVIQYMSSPTMYYMLVIQMINSIVPTNAIPLSSMMQLSLAITNILRSNAESLKSVVIPDTDGPNMIPAENSLDTNFRTSNGNIVDIPNPNDVTTQIQNAVQTYGEPLSEDMQNELTRALSSNVAELLKPLYQNIAYTRKLRFDDSDALSRREVRSLERRHPDGDQVVAVPVQNVTSLSSTNATLPITNSTLPSTNSTLLSTNSTLPSINSILPLTNSTLPSLNSTLPSTNSTLPSTNSTLLSTNSILPPTNSTLPSTNSTIPSTNSVIPPTNSSLPSTNSTLPLTNSTLPSKNSTILMTNSALPSAPMTIPGIEIIDAKGPAAHTIAMDNQTSTHPTSTFPNVNLIINPSSSPAILPPNVLPNELSSHSQNPDLLTSLLSVPASALQSVPNIASLIPNPLKCIYSLMSSIATIYPNIQLSVLVGLATAVTQIVARVLEMIASFVGIFAAFGKRRRRDFTSDSPISSLNMDEILNDLHKDIKKAVDTYIPEAPNSKKHDLTSSLYKDSVDIILDTYKPMEEMLKNNKIEQSQPNGNINIGLGNIENQNNVFENPGSIINGFADSSLKNYNERVNNNLKRQNDVLSLSNDQSNQYAIQDNANDLPDYFSNSLRTLDNLSPNMNSLQKQTDSFVNSDSMVDPYYYNSNLKSQTELWNKK